MAAVLRQPEPQRRAVVVLLQRRAAVVLLQRRAVVPRQPEPQRRAAVVLLQRWVAVALPQRQAAVVLLQRWVAVALPQRRVAAGQRSLGQTAKRLPVAEFVEGPELALRSEPQLAQEEPRAQGDQGHRPRR